MQLRQAGSESRMPRVLVFLIHQFIGTIGVLAAAPFLVGLGFDLSRLFGHPVSIRRLHWILTETPYFPTQVALAVLLGCLVGRYLRHKSALWIWVLPLLILVAAFVVRPTVTSLTFASRLSHFFGWACRPEERCFDQLAFTLPLYSAVSYSIGATVGRTLSKMSKTTTEPREGSAAGARFLAR